MFYNKFSHLASTAGFCGGFLTTPVISRMKFIGGVVGVGGGWEAEGGENHPQGGKQHACSAVSSVGHRNHHS